MAKSETVFIVDDDEAIREAVASLVGEMGVHCECFGSAEEFLEKYDGRRPACLVTDVRMLRMSGLELQEELNNLGWRIATVVLTAYAETPVTVRAIKNGAVTLLEKPCRNLELWDAIRNALAQDQENFEADRQRSEISQRLESLTPSESRVMELVVAGEPNKAIANKLELSVRTVEVRRQSIFAKLGAGSVAELVRLVVEAKPNE
ncbi:Response regulator protein TmoT [Posidoniimonas polymericola]|uniref:Response regulator protein TmoT n=1 Tax=Posidoniimonas polymericola TaxID=2528002 RepID=A0A5C5YSB8_9BACT|nr:response regulator [Posidoniimonas polymericola]TWT77683.1 Response regulator protein TmoT [Posidoniimonas polymericola]